MINTSEVYKSAIVADARQMVLKAVIDIIDPNVTYGSATSSEAESFADLTQLHNKVFKLDQYASLERNYWILDGSAKVGTSGEVGFVSTALSDDNGEFSDAQWISLNFSNVEILQAFSLFFPDAVNDGIPKDFKVEVKSAGTTYYEKNITNNKRSTLAFDGFTIYNPDQIMVTITKWSLPHRRCRVVEILAGIYEEWGGDVIAEFSMKHQGDVSNTKLPYGTCSIKIDNIDRRFEPRNKSGIFQSITEGQSIDVSIGVKTESGTEYVPAGRFYQTSGGWKTSDNDIAIKWDLVDIVGLLSDREYIVPATLPTTLRGWARSFVGQLGPNFENRYHIDEAYADLPVTASSNDVAGRRIGELIRYAAMVTDTWARADAETGFLTFEPLWNQGNQITLDNMQRYPTMQANDEIATITFDIAGSKLTVSGGGQNSSSSLSINNPFIHSDTQALKCARQILTAYSGNKLEITGRGDPASEIGDVDTVWLSESQATTARRIMSDLSFTNGVLAGAKSTLLQAEGALFFQTCELITESGTWTAPAGVTHLKIAVVGGGSGGGHGDRGGWAGEDGDGKGEDGANGAGGKVFYDNISITSGQSFEVVIGQGGAQAMTGTGTIFGRYSSDDGELMPYGYTNVITGDSFARTGVQAPLANSGDGGKGGRGGTAGVRHERVRVDSEGNEHRTWIVDVPRGEGQPGAAGASGCVLVQYDKDEVTV